MRQFFVDPSAVGESTITITGEDVKHISRVLRLREGDPIVISDRASWEYRCEIQSMDREAVVARILDKQKFAREPAIQITLFQGIPKGSKMETVIQKCTELGVSTFVPVFMDRTQGQDRQRYEKKRKRLETIASEAAKQCRRGRIPKIADAITGEELEKILVENSTKKTREQLATNTSRQRDYDLILMPYENEEGRTIRDVLSKWKDQERSPDPHAESPDRSVSVAVIIGPEGGFSDEEASSLRQTGALTCSLGKTILRTETAGMVAVSCIMYELEW